MTRSVRTVLGTLVVLMSLAPASVDAQRIVAFDRATNVAVGYVANMPDQLLGFSAMTVGERWGGWGLYLDYKQSLDSPGDDPTFRPGVTPQEALNTGNDEFGQESQWTGFNVAVVRTISDELAVYAGAGWADQTVYREFLDPDGDPLTPFFWVEDEAVSGTEVNVLGGFYFRLMQNVLFQFGSQTAPGGVTAGISLGVPLGG